MHTRMSMFSSPKPRRGFGAEPTGGAQLARSVGAEAAALVEEIKARRARFEKENPEPAARGPKGRTKPGGDGSGVGDGQTGVLCGGFALKDKEQKAWERDSHGK